MESVVTDHLEQAKRGGVPGTYPLVRSFVSLRLPGGYLGLQDGLVDDRPIWPMVYYCLRSGDLAAALHCLKQAGYTLFIIYYTFYTISLRYYAAYFPTKGKYPTKYCYIYNRHYLNPYGCRV